MEPATFEEAKSVIGPTISEMDNASRPTCGEDVARGSINSKVVLGTNETGQAIGGSPHPNQG